MNRVLVVVSSNIRPAWQFARGTFAALALSFVGMTAHAADVPDYAVKAAYLYKFGEFIEWPAAAFDAATGATRLCVASDDAFADILDGVMKDRKIGGRNITIQRLKTVTDKSGCHILYIAGADQNWVSQNIGAVRGTPVLTITDGAKDLPATGIINLVLKDNRVRFVIDNDAAAQNQLQISSKLLSLALRAGDRK